MAVVDLPDGALHTAILRNNLRVLRLHTSGPRAVFTDARGPEGKYNEMIFLADVASGSVRKIHTATEGWHVWEPVIDGTVVYWMEGKSEQWRIRSLGVTSGDLSTVLDGHGDPSYNLAAGDGRLALVRRNSGGSDAIEVRSLPGARLIRTIETDGRAYKVALSGDAVFYSSGKVDSAGLMTTANAWLSTPSHPAPLLVAKDAYELDAHDGILTWVSDPAGHGRSDRVMAARIDDVAPVALTPSPHGDLTGSAWPATGSGFVAWRSDWAGLKVPARLSVWSPGMGAPVGIGGTAAVGMVGIRDGWVVWFTEYDEYADPPTPAMIAGIRVADLATALNQGR
ncbi:MAG: TolB family protein [Candidatus Limnocylindrales bacterium]